MLMLMLWLTSSVNVNVSVNVLMLMSVLMVDQQCCVRQKDRARKFTSPIVTPRWFCSDDTITITILIFHQLLLELQHATLCFERITFWSASSRSSALPLHIVHTVGGGV